MVKLHELENKWSNILNQDSIANDKIPLLGLAPFSESESKLISEAFYEYSRPFPDKLVGLLAALEEFPAVISTWLSITAANNYKDKAFWMPFSQGLGLPTNLLSSQKQRDSLTGAFRRSCRRLNRYTLDSGGELVQEFLFQAGFPVCHSHHIASAIRSIARRDELPDIHDINAAEKLTDELIIYFSNRSLSTVTRALKSSAGPLIAQVALDALFSENFININPRFADALKEEFQTSQGSLNGPKLSPLYIALNEQLTGYVLTIPKQREDYFRQKEVNWIINGELFRIPVNETFLYEIEDDAVSLEVAFLTSAGDRRLSFDIESFLKPKDRVLFFDRTTNRYKRHFDVDENNVQIPPGEYIVVMPMEFTCEADILEAWIDVKLAVIDIEPNSSIQFISRNGQKIRVTPTIKPFIEFYGGRTIGEYGTRLLISTNNPIKARCYLPTTSGEARLRLSSQYSYDEESIQLEYNVNESFVEIDLCGLLEELPSAIHEIRAALEINGRERCETTTFFWKGCNDVLPSGSIQLESLPENVEYKQCKGFTAKEKSLDVVQDDSAYRLICFTVSGQTRQTSWKNPGLHMDLVRRKIGDHSQTTSLPIGSKILLPNNDSQIRIWINVCDSVVISLGGSEPTCNLSRGFLSISCAEIYYDYKDTLLKNGCCELTAIIGSQTILLARFIMQAVAEKIRGERDAHQIAISCLFNEFNNSVIIQADNLIGNEKLLSDGVTLDSLEGRSHIRLGNDAAVAVSFSEVYEQENCIEVHFSIVANQWPPGIWSIMVMTKDTMTIVKDQSGVSARVLLITPPSKDARDFRQNIAWAAVSGVRLGSGHPLKMEDLFVLSQSVGYFRRIQEAIGPGPLPGDFDWIDRIEDSIIDQIEVMIKDNDENAPFALANLSSSKVNTRELFLLPRAMSFRRECYFDIAPRNSVFRALRLCAEMSSYNDLRQYTEEVPERYSDTFIAYLIGGWSNDNSEVYIPAHNSVKRFWRELQLANRELHFDEATGNGLLSIEHWNAAISQFLSSYENKQNDITMGYANGYVCNAARFRSILEKQVGKTANMILDVLKLPSPQLEYDSDFCNNMPLFCSCLALSVRADAYGLLNLKEVLSCLESLLPHGRSKQEGLKSIFELAPMLFGFFLLFWEAHLKNLGY